VRWGDVPGAALRLPQPGEPPSPRLGVPPPSCEQTPELVTASSTKGIAALIRSNTSEYHDVRGRSTDPGRGQRRLHRGVPLRRVQVATRARFRRLNLPVPTPHAHVRSAPREDYE